MSFFDGNAPEMPEHRPVDDGEIEAALAGTTRGTGPESLSAFVSAVRSVVEAVPTPSTAMAAVLAAGLSTEKGDLSATAASNVNGPASQEAGLPKWRKALMKIQGFLAGLGVVGKIALGVGVAAAATTGAGAAGVLPFSVPGIGHTHRHTVTVHSDTTTTRPKVRVRPAAAHPSVVGHHVVVVKPHETVTTPTTTKVTTPTSVYDPPATTTTVNVTDPSPTTTPTAGTTPTHGDDPTTTTTADEPPSTTTTTTGSDAPSQSIQLSCQVSGPQQVTCTWTASSTPVAKYALWRWTTGGTGSDYGPIDETADGLTFVVNNVAPDVRYTYRVFTTLSDGTSGPFSNKDYMDPLNP